MRIAILAHLKFPIAQPFSGGLEMHTHLLARMLLARGHDVTLYAADGSDGAMGLEPLCGPTGEARSPGASQLRVDRAELSAYADMMARVSRGGFDIVHNNSLHFFPLRHAVLHGMPMLTTLHTPPFSPLLDGFHGLTAAQTFVAVSWDCAAHWAGLVAKVTVVSNGIDLCDFVPRTGAGAEPYAFWSGRIVEEKGLHLAIDAARHAGLPLRFAGPRPDALYWSAKIAPRLGGDLIDLGHLDHRALAAHLAAASVAVVSPLWDEPFGLVVAEALACGTPVAAFARGAVPELLDARCGALAAPDDSAALGGAIRRAMRLDRGACRTRAETRFDAERMTDRYEQLYRAMLARTCAVRPELAFALTLGAGDRDGGHA